jgi:hypothetical protein
VTRGTIAEIYHGLRRNPEVLGQTALSTRARGPATILVTRMPARDRRDLGIRLAATLEEAVRVVLADFAQAGFPRPAYYLMPEAGALVPFVSAV